MIIKVEHSSLLNGDKARNFVPHIILNHIHGDVVKEVHAYHHDILVSTFDVIEVETSELHGQSYLYLQSTWAVDNLEEVLGGPLEV